MEVERYCKIYTLSQFKYHGLHFGMSQTNVLFLTFEILALAFS